MIPPFFLAVSILASPVAIKLSILVHFAVPTLSVFPAFDVTVTGNSNGKPPPMVGDSSSLTVAPVKIENLP